MKYRKNNKNSPSYQGERPDIVKFINNASNVLDVGCNTGAVAGQIRRRFPDARIIGLDYNYKALSVAKNNLTNGYCLDLDNHFQLEHILKNYRFDTIIAGDVLEHTKNPEHIVDLLFNSLTANGKILVSIPNVAHWELIYHWIRQKWPARERGIFDNTHYRFFMRGNISDLVPEKGELRLLSRNYRLFEARRTRLDSITDKIFSVLPWFREYFVFQYIFVICKSSK